MKRETKNGNKSHFLYNLITLLNYICTGGVTEMGTTVQRMLPQQGQTSGAADGFFPVNSHQITIPCILSDSRRLWRTFYNKTGTLKMTRYEIFISSNTTERKRYRASHILLIIPDIVLIINCCYWYILRITDILMSLLRSADKYWLNTFATEKYW